MVGASRIIRVEIDHTRLRPVRHSFQYSSPFYVIDLKTPPPSSLLFARNSFGVFSLHDSDYLRSDSRSLLEKVTAILEEHALGEYAHQVLLATNLRLFNYVFNPVSFYFCSNREGKLGALLSEVNNTFGEKHLYVTPVDDGQALTTKEFHVSPFFDRAGEYHFRFQEIEKELDVAVDLIREDEHQICTRIREVESYPFTPAMLLKTLLRRPFDGLLTFPRIVWQAAILKFRHRLPVHSKPVPTSPMTLRVPNPTLLQRFAMKRVFTFLSRLERGSLVVALPSGEQMLFGTEESSPRAEIRIRDYSAFTKILFRGDIGFGESYVAGLWETPDLGEVLRVFTQNLEKVDDRSLFLSWCGRVINIVQHYLRINTIRNARANIRRHYDLSNDLFQAFLDRSMTYSCAIFQNEQTSLEEAQLTKIRELIRKADLKPTDEVLEIGCGWGSFAILAAQEVGCRVTAITLSTEQRDFAVQRVRELGLEDKVSIRLVDYRAMEGSFDKIVSIEMIEAVGHRYFGDYFRKIDTLLKPGGKVVIQAITVPDQRYTWYRFGCDWIQRYIFPGGLCPSLEVLRTAIAKNSSLAIHKVENFGVHYARTLKEWRTRFSSAFEDLRRYGFDETFQRQWTYYLTYCEEGFSCRVLDTLHLVLEKPRSER